jgi:hypothetical protein
MTEKLIKEELQGYSERCYAEILQQKGFVSYKNDLLNWYKINNGIIYHFHLLVGSCKFPVMMQVWWIHPTYIPATLNLPVAWTNFNEPMSLYATKVLFDSHIVENGGGINIPKLPKLGAERLLSDLFPQIEKQRTRETAYQQLKQRIMNWWAGRDTEYPLSNLTTSDFADQALMVQDTEFFPSCIERVGREIQMSQYPHNMRFAETSVAGRSAALLQAQLKALQGIEVEQYMELLKERKAKFFKKYKLQDIDFEL